MLSHKTINHLWLPGSISWLCCLRCCACVFHRRLTRLHLFVNLCRFSIRFIFATEPQDAQILEGIRMVMIPIVLLTVTHHSFWMQSCLTTFLFLKHWMLLSWAVYQLLQESVSPESLRNARVALEKCVIYTARPYGKEHVSYNGHQLVHWPDTVHTWGPLWAVMFSFWKHEAWDSAYSYWNSRKVPHYAVPSFIRTTLYPECFQRSIRNVC